VKVCEYCGRESGDEDVHCGGCGTPFGSVPPTQTPQRGWGKLKRKTEVLTRTLSRLGAQVDRGRWIEAGRVAIIIGGIWFTAMIVRRQYQYQSLTQQHPIARFEYPAATALTVVHTDMLLWQGRELAWPMTRVLPPLSGWFVNDLPEVDCELLREAMSYLAMERRDTYDIAKLRAQLAVILAETGSKTAAFKELELLSDDSAFTNFARAAKAIYSDALPDRDLDRTTVCSLLRTYWPRWEFEMRWLSLTKEDLPRLARLSQWQRDRAKRKFYQLTALSACQVAALAAGIWLLASRLRSHIAAGIQRHSEPLVPWSAWEGWGMFLGTIALGEAFWAMNRYFLPFSILDLSPNLVMIGPVILFLGLLYAGRATPVLQVLGLSRLRGRVPFLTAVSLATFTLDRGAMMLVSPVLRIAGVEEHWADSFTEDELFGGGLTQFWVLVNGVIWAPILEELLFRGVLYSALRQKFGIIASAAFSAVLFAAGHYYTWPGLIEMTIYGIASALAFELTRSLVPCMLAHIVMNLFASGFTVMLYSV
jgi:membrane protease YdiL (CAAX protease family)